MHVCETDCRGLVFFNEGQNMTFWKITEQRVVF